MGYNKKTNKKGALAIGQISILLISLIAFGFILGGMDIVSAADTECQKQGGACADINTNECSAGFVSNLCPGANNIQCCKGKITPKTDSDKDKDEDKKTPPIVDEAAKAAEQAAIDALLKKGEDEINQRMTSKTKLPSEGNKNVIGDPEDDLFEPWMFDEDDLENVPKELLKDETKPTVPTPPVKKGFKFKNLIKISNIGDASAGALVGYVAINAAASIGTAYTVAALADLAGAGERNVRGLVNIGVITASLSTILGAAVVSFGYFTWPLVLVSQGIWALTSYQDFSQEIFTYQVGLWQPESGGEKCSECNDLRYGCDEYQCKSFGLACELINQDQSLELQECVWDNPRDTSKPEITPLESALISEDYKYVNSDAILPPERGAQIFYDDPKTNEIEECVPPFSTIEIGVNTSKLATCKIDIDRKPKYEDMISDLQNTIPKYEHSITIPSSATASDEAREAAGWELNTGKNYEFFIRCASRNGYASTHNFVMDFCVQEGPETSPPTIISTNYQSGTYVPFGQSTVPLEVYTDEPADCRWDFNDVDYEVMQNEMDDCSKDAGDYLDESAYIYGCTGELNGIKDRVDNNFYIRCKDKPWWQEGDKGQRFANRESYELLLKGSEPLIINYVTVNDKENGSTIKDSTDRIKVILKVGTSAGANEGNSICQYKSGDRYFDFYNNGERGYFFENTQDFYLFEGDYNYEIKCLDQANNAAYTNVEFIIDTDTSEPLVARAYYEEGYLKLITTESSECVYSTETCNYPFEDGTVITVLDEVNHFLEWDTTTDLFVKCKDEFGNRPPLQDECSIIVRAYEDF